MHRPFLPPSLRHFEPRRTALVDERSPVVFAYDLVQALRPRLVVDLGAAEGTVFFACCQSLRDHDIDGVCYAIDDWKAYTGDGAPSFDDVNAHGRQHYLGSTYFVPMEPDSALPHFGPGAIDLLVVSGHAPSVAEENVVEWLHRVGPAGAVLLRDREGDAGVRIWRALQAAPRFMSFAVLSAGAAVGAPDRGAAPLLELIADPGQHEALRGFYEHVAEYHTLRIAAGSQAFVGKRKPGT